MEQARHCCNVGGNAKAQLGQRWAGWAKVCTHSSHSAWEGQAWHTAQILGMRRLNPWVNALNIGPIYSRSRVFPWSMTTHKPPTIDPVAAARWAQMPVPQSPWLHEEIARRMEDRLQWIVQKPATWLDWEPSRGGLEGHALVQKRYPQAQVFVHEEAQSRLTVSREALSPAWWNPARWGGGTVQFGMPSEPVQMLWANMALHMASDPQALISRWHQALAVDGFAMFSCLGPDTVRELRDVYADAGWPQPHHQFTDMHDWGDMLVHAGFAEPVMDMERITLSYSSSEKLLDELRGLGRNLHINRFAGLRTRAWKQQLLDRLFQRWGEKSADGRLSLTFEVVYGHAFKPKPKVKLQTETRVSLDDMRAVLKK